jgi:hypothetical protein
MFLLQFWSKPSNRGYISSVPRFQSAVKEPSTTTEVEDWMRVLVLKEARSTRRRNKERSGARESEWKATQPGVARDLERSTTVTISCAFLE